MIEELTVQEPGIGAFKATGKLTDADYQQFVPHLQELIQHYGKISLFLELEEFHGWDAKAAWDDLKVGFEHADDFERLAIVGDQAWEHWIALLAKPFTRARVRYFDAKDRDAAWDWLKQNALSAVQSQQRSVREYTRVLVPIDFSAQSAQVLKRGLWLASRDGAAVTVIHVVDQPIYERAYTDPVLPQVSEHTVRQVELARTRLERLVESLGAPRADCIAVAGPAKLEITRHAKQNGIDLIVVGSHGLGGVGSMFGSTVRTVVEQASCDVVVVRVTT